ncbi:hypothetical protein [Actinopolymorpha rutila]|uniref:Peptidoglycan/LPS O-acetylase OafA/YrhL n=1 Tax=Actinopolymorpha rutila TaxID=446787 RepID=A0A852ZJG3_9ACTN|nr:hypothetical protein [Actinopolymorpha rutila]NYH93197.1 peptidoglycan/LPS O-acetylase OafA/YrhL [Actinopolymorpha rutila]
MGLGSGILLIVVGAILYGAVDVDLPYVDDDALGLILLLAGLAVVIVAVVLRADRPERGVGTGIVLIAAGAILYFAVDADLPYIADDAMGAILMVAGAIAIVATAVMSRRRTPSRRSVQGYYQP